MVFSSLIFVFRFLPLFFIIYYVAPKKWHNVILLIGSIIFYSFGEPKYAILIVASVIVNFFMAKWINCCKYRGVCSKILLAITLCYNIGILGFFKYSNFILENVNHLTHNDSKLPNVILPLGISFYTFQILSYVIDVYKGKSKVETSIIRLGAYLCMFPQLIAGPIVLYNTVSIELQNRHVNLKKFEDGIKTFTIGLGYKVLLANHLGIIWDSMQQIGYQNLSAPLAWTGIFAFTLQIYFDFNGYSLMAIGLGEMLGFHFPQNFNYPYISKSVSEFWKRWHITLTDWFREYIYIPLGGNRKGKFRTYLNLFIVWSITGIWHGAGWNFLCWGLYYFCFIAVERMVLKKYIEKNEIVSRIYTLFVVMCGWVIFAITDIKEIYIYFSRMFSFEISKDIYPYLENYWILFVVAILLATPIFKRSYECIKDKFFGITVLLVVFWASIVSLVDAVYNPFLYFRF
ncbi:MAG: MBOAT family protein [Lachnospiraceae bacterium]|nr:MBOAT family protein [Lachnospiraceae bacterium]